MQIRGIHLENGCWFQLTDYVPYEIPAYSKRYPMMQYASFQWTADDL